MSKSRSAEWFIRDGDNDNDDNDEEKKKTTVVDHDRIARQQQQRGGSVACDLFTEPSGVERESARGFSALGGAFLVRRERCVESDDSAFFHSLFYRVTRGRERKEHLRRIYTTRTTTTITTTITHTQKKRALKAELRRHIRDSVYHSRLDKPDVRENYKYRDTNKKTYTHYVYRCLCDSFSVPLAFRIE